MRFSRTRPASAESVPATISTGTDSRMIRRMRSWSDHQPTAPMPRATSPSTLPSTVDLVPVPTT
jgi:hypothetical protein